MTLSIMHLFGSGEQLLNSTSLHDGAMAMLNKSSVRGARPAAPAVGPPSYILEGDFFWKRIGIMAAGALFVALTLIITACLVQEGCCLYNIMRKFA